MGQVNKETGDKLDGFGTLIQPIVSRPLHSEPQIGGGSFLRPVKMKTDDHPLGKQHGQEEVQHDNGAECYRNDSGGPHSKREYSCCPQID